MKKILSRREQIISYFTVFIVIFSIVFNILRTTAFSKNDSLNREIDANRKKLKKYLRLLSQKELIMRKYGAFVVPEGLDVKEDSFSALSELENLANKSNIRIVDIRPDTTKTSKGFRETIVDLRAEGGMEGYLKFIYNIEHSASSLSIKKLQLNSKPNLQTIEGVFTISQFLNLE